MNAAENEDPGKIRITLEDLDAVQPVRGEDPVETSYGSITAESSAPVIAGQESGNFFLKSWVYLGLAGLAGALLAWGICEPWFVDPGRPTWANVALFPLMIILTCIGFGVAESIAEGSPRRALARGALSLGLGAAIGFFFFIVAGLVYAIGLTFVRAAGGAVTEKSPGLWLARSLAWSLFGVSGGLVYGIIGQSGKRCLYGILGGIVGAGLGGLLFDPIGMLTHGGAISRGVGMALYGAATGIAIGLVESALKDRWLYVASGPLAGKQFILYKTVSTMGSDTNSDLYLFKDTSIQPRHAQVEVQGRRVYLRAFGPLFVNGRAAGDTALSSGDFIQIGRYGFHYRDRERGRS